MSLTPEQVRHIARLARLGIDDSEVERFAGQLSEILDYFERLRQVDTEDVAPTAHTLPLHNVFRNDEPVPSLEPDQTLANAPQREGDLFRVRAVLDE
ncbi:MAG TPA: Asp-tRNA(Asn)/Glu-tRNA(Gln) amidotransferase subunit GatC [Dehalococcoidia bacterium]|nr:Asp-tRNA(Asn)/Glu-tRNA(Gln) amidotransferase subunit GatC [Dehalococcoidia bacterium]